MPLSYAARRRLSLLVLVVGLPAYIVVAVTLMNWLDRSWGRQPFAIELAVYVGLGILWALPFRRLFRGIGRPDPEAGRARAAEPRAGEGPAGQEPAGRTPDRPA